MNDLVLVEILHTCERVGVCAGWVGGGGGVRGSAVASTCACLCGYGGEVCRPSIQL